MGGDKLSPSCIAFVFIPVITVILKLTTIFTRIENCLKHIQSVKALYAAVSSAVCSWVPCRQTCLSLVYDADQPPA